MFSYSHLGQIHTYDPAIKLISLVVNKVNCTTPDENLSDLNPDCSNSRSITFADFHPCFILKFKLTDYQMKCTLTLSWPVFDFYILNLNVYFGILSNNGNQVYKNSTTNHMWVHLSILLTFWMNEWANKNYFDRKMNTDWIHSYFSRPVQALFTQTIIVSEINLFSVIAFSWYFFTVGENLNVASLIFEVVLCVLPPSCKREISPSGPLQACRMELGIWTRILRT